MPTRPTIPRLRRVIPRTAQPLPIDLVDDDRRLAADDVFAERDKPVATDCLAKLGTDRGTRGKVASHFVPESVGTPQGQCGAAIFAHVEQLEVRGDETCHGCRIVLVECLQESTGDIGGSAFLSLRGHRAAHDQAYCSYPVAEGARRTHRRVPPGGTSVPFLDRSSWFTIPPTPQ